MSKKEIKVWAGYMAFLFFILLFVMFVSGCDSGWSVSGWEI